MMVSAAGKRYGQAFFDLARDEGEIKPLEKDLKRLAELWEEDKDLRSLLFHPRINVDSKKEVLQKLGEDIHPLTRNLLLLLADKGRLKQVPEIARVFTEAREEHENILRVEVLTARPLPQEIEQKLKNRLERATGKGVQLEIVRDSSIIGGLVLKVGDLLIDGSLQRGLEKLQEKLRGIQVSQIGVNER